MDQSPAQGQDTGKMCAHLSKEERATLRRYGVLGGLFPALSFDAFVGVIFAYRQSILLFAALLVLLIPIEGIAVIGICHVRKRMKALLASAAQARKESL